MTHSDGIWRSQKREIKFVTLASSKNFLEIIGRKNWIQKSLEAEKTPTESNQKPNYQER